MWYELFHNQIIGGSDSPVAKKSKSKSDKSSKGEKVLTEKQVKANRRKKARAEKDPNAPKKPLTAFMLYTNKRRPEVMKNNAGLKITEISTIIGKEWKELTQEEKDVSIPKPKTLELES